MKNARLPAGRGLRLERMAAEQRQIPGVGAEREVVQVAQERDQADRQVDDQVHGHPGDDDAGDAEPRRLGDDPCADDPRDDVAHHRDEADDRVEPDLDRRARDPDELVERVRDPLDPPLGRVEAFAPAGTDDLASDRTLHRSSVRRGRVHPDPAWTDVHIDFMTDAEWCRACQRLRCLQHETDRRTTRPSTGGASTLRRDAGRRRSRQS